MPKRNSRRSFCRESPEVLLGDTPGAIPGGKPRRNSRRNCYWNSPEQFLEEIPREIPGGNPGGLILYENPQIDSWIKSAEEFLKEFLDEILREILGNILQNS